ncbi:hypothetical protein [Deinococcus wulumuqiensis]|uniref:hypothetical protein n=1 Tax=Deinococcus wulumuqiensis TaxID=980427 RepID=UPI0035EAEF1C
MRKNEPIVGRVALLISTRELAINVGSSSGVKEGMVFAVLAEQPLDVIDPETGEKLDTIDREKVRVKVVEVREKMSVCATFKARHIPGTKGMLGSNGQPSLGYIGVGGSEGLYGRPPQKIVETLRIEDSATLPPLAPEDSYVKVKDRVVEC